VLGRVRMCHLPRDHRMGGFKIFKREHHANSCSPLILDKNTAGVHPPIKNFSSPHGWICLPKSVGNITSSSSLARYVHISSQVERNLGRKRQLWDSCRTPFQALSIVPSDTILDKNTAGVRTAGSEELQRGLGTRFVMAEKSGGLAGGRAAVKATSVGTSKKGPVFEDQAA